MTVCAGDLCGRLTEMGKVSSMQGAPSKNSSSLLGSLLTELVEALRGGSLQFKVKSLILAQIERWRHA